MTDHRLPQAPDRLPATRFEGEEVCELLRYSERRLEDLRGARASYEATWRELSDYVYPTRGRFGPPPGSHSRGRRRGEKIVDRTATKAVKRLAAFLLAGICSPARPWFRLDPGDAALGGDPEVESYCAAVAERMLEVFAASNFYGAMSGAFEEVSTFATTAVLVQQDYEDVARFYLYTAGEYFVATSPRGQVDTFYRDFAMTVDQLVREYGIENVSDNVRSLYENRNLSAEVRVVHAIEPNRYLKRDRRDWRGLPYVSVYFEAGQSSERALSIKGYHEFPVACPRWDVIANDAYGRGPGEDVLPDVIALQVQQLRLAEAVEKMVRPPLIGDAALQSSTLSLVPGGVNFVPGASAIGLKSVYDVRLDLSALQVKIQETQRAIIEGFFNDLIAMFSGGDGPQMTAEEVRAKLKEKMLLLGPMLERFHDECLTPIIEIVYAIMERGRLLPDAPKALRGKHLKPTYVSDLAQAQRAVGTASIEGLMRFIGGLVAVSPEVMDGVDVDEVVRRYRELLGSDPRLLRAKDEVDKMRQARAQKAQQQEAMQAGMTAAQGAQTLSKTDLGNGQNALGLMLGNGGGSF